MAFDGFSSVVQHGNLERNCVACDWRAANANMMADNSVTLYGNPCYCALCNFVFDAYVLSYSENACFSKRCKS